MFSLKLQSAQQAFNLFLAQILQICTNPNRCKAFLQVGIFKNADLTKYLL